MALVMRLTPLLLLVAVCSCLAGVSRAADDIDNNEVLPENDVVRARVDEVADKLPETSTTPSSSSAPENKPTSTDGPDASKAPKDVPAPATTAPTRPASTLSRFLSDIIQIPIAVLRSVGSLLSNTFSGQRGPASGSSSSGSSGSSSSGSSGSSSSSSDSHR